MAGARETSCFGGLTSTCRDGRRRSERLYVDVCGFHFVAGAVPGTWWLSSACSVFAAGAVSRDLFGHVARFQKLFGILMLSLEVLLLRIALAGCST